MKKLLTTLSSIALFAIFFITPDTQAQTTSYVPDDVILTVNCNSTDHICLNTLNINKITYEGTKHFCNGYISGNCNLNTQGGFYGTDSMQVLKADLDDQIRLSANNATEKIVGYTDCIIDASNNGNATCKTITSNYTPYTSPGVPYGWVNTTSSGYTIASFTFRPVTTCGSGNTYVRGKGCAVTQGTYAGITYTTLLPSLSGSSTNQSCVQPEAAKGEAVSQCKSGNPVDINTGAKIETHSDLNFHIPFNRTYSSLRSEYGTLGGGWKHQFDKKLSLIIESVAGQEVAFGLTFTFENSEEVSFNRDNSTDPFVVAFNNHKGYSVSMLGSTYVLNAPNGNKEYYDSTGKLIKIINRNGYTYDFVYNTLNQLSTVTDSYGKTLTFTYSDYANVITQVLSSTGDYVQYTYLNGLLTQAKYNNTETIGYDYTNGLLSSKTDAKSNVYAFYTYDSSRRVIESKHLDAPNSYHGLNQYAYITNNVAHTLPDGSVSSYDTLRDIYRSKTSTTSISGGKNTASLSYDANGNVNSFYDGIDTSTYTYDSATNLMTSSNHKGTVRNYTWNPTTRQINSYTEATSSFTRTYSFTYDSYGNMTQKQVTSGSDSRVWNYTYGTFGKLLSMTEPNGATTTYTYYADDNSNVNLRGLVQTVTNGVGHTITINSYNYQGLPTNISMLNGLSKSMTYDLRGRVITETSVDGTNTYVYDLSGSLLQASFANGYILSMTYDIDHRMTGMSDNRGNSLTYTLDTNGNPVNESEYTGSTLVSVKNKVFDGLSRMTQVSRSSNAYPYNYTYDKLDRVINVQNPNIQSQSITYDNKDNITAINEPGRNQNMTRDDDGNMTGINQQGNTHSYTYNGLGEMLTMTNIDTGSHSYTYNIPNKTTTHTDNAGVIHTNTYDNLGRLLSDSTSTTSHTYTWDTIKAGKLSSITDNSGTTSYGYDSVARLTSKTQAVGSYSKSVGYSYDSSGQLNKITYPSGLQTNYQYSNGVVSGIQVDSTLILSSIGYKGFNSTPVSWTWGNSTSRVLGIDANQRLTGLADGSVMNQGISQDNLNNVTAVSDSANTNNSFTASYSASEQLTSFNQSSVSRNYEQDSRFNLQRIAPFDTNYTQVYFGFNFPSNTIYNLSYAGSPYLERYIGKDSKGNMTSDGTGATFTYDANNNMVSANKISPATYVYNALSQRVAKTVTISGIPYTTYYVYNEAGLLIGEYDSSGVAIAEHIYLGSIPVAVVKSGTIYYVHTDHLGTPRVITNTSGTVMWKWDNTNAYGYNSANETVSGPLFEYNIRFAGQYFDKESGLHYNYHRMYNPELGRYMQPDPIGVAGGMNLYSYVENNPLNASDPYGLEPGYINFGLTKNKSSFDYIGFKAEEIYKMNFSDPKEQLILLSHGSTFSLNGNKALELANQIITGKYQTNNGLIINNYYTEQILSGKPINLKLDACKTGLDTKDGAYAQQLLNILQYDLNKRGAKNVLFITAPNGDAYFRPWGDIIKQENNSKGNFITFKQE